MNKLNFFRLDYATQADIDSWVRSRSLPDSATELRMKVRVGDHVLAAHYDQHSGMGQVQAIGRVMRMDAVLDIEWRTVKKNLQPNPQGRRFWQQTHFRFADSVAERYGLRKICDELFADLPTPTSHAATLASAANIARTKSLRDADPGYVYVIRSPHGYKIGKSRRLHDRTRLFAVKLPFPIEVVMTGWFPNCSEAERRLHRTFHDKRLEGEWFALDNHDLNVLRDALSQNGGGPGATTR